MRKFEQTPGALRAEVTGELMRNDKGRVRIGRFGVTIRLSDEAGAIQHFDRCLAQFEDFCVVTENVRHGIPVGVRVVGPGTLQARVPVSLSSRITATVRQLNVDVGDSVKRGQTLALLDDRDRAARRGDRAGRLVRRSEGA